MPSKNHPHKNHPQLDQTASCACGAISLRIIGQPLSMFYCACLDCQKATGSGHSALVLVKTDDLTVSGQTASFELTAASGHRIERHFCPTCGTPLFGHSAGHDAFNLLPAGIFHPNDWFVPRALIFSRSKNHWDDINESLPHYQTYREKTST